MLKIYRIRKAGFTIGGDIQVKMPQKHKIWIFSLGRR